MTALTLRPILRWPRALASAALLVLLLASLHPIPVLAATLLVNLPGDAGTGAGTSGDIRYVVNQANASPGSTITFDTAGTGPVIMLTHGTLTLSANVTITGPGAATLAVDGNNAVTVFTVSSGVTTRISGLTIQHGNNTVTGNGGGIFNNGTLTLTNSMLSGNTAFSGGGIWNNNSATMTVTNTTFSSNSAHANGAGGIGGGIYNGIFGMLTVTNSTFSGNVAVNGPNGGFGGGIYTDSATLAVTNTTFSGNSATGTSGGGNGGGIFSSAGNVTVTNSTFSGNSANGANGAGGFGGGIDNDGSNLTVTNSTFSGNGASISFGNLGGGAGGGIYNSGALTVTNSTFSGNSASNGSGGVGGGGGIDSEGFPATVTATNTIIAGNSATPGGADVMATVTSGGHNLIGKTDGSSGWIASDQTGTAASPLSANLGPLANYGGLTQTLPLLPGSPAIDAGDDMTCSAAPVSGKDQRGISRPQGAHCDSGAFESQGFTLAMTSGDNQTTIVNTPFANPLVVTMISTHNEPVGGGSVTFTGPASGAGIRNSPLTGTIGGNGQASVTATANGTPGGPYTVTASAAGATPTVAFSLTNIAATLVSITVTPANTSLKVGQVQQYTATGTYSDSNTADLTSQVTWSSDAPSVVSVDASGKGTAKVAGTAHITAAKGSVSGQATVTVTPPVLTGVQPAPVPNSRPGGAGVGGTTTPAPAPSGSPPSSGSAPVAAPAGRP